MDDNFPIEIKNFGSIKEAKLDIKPLTVFIGPNNSGKSYAALLYHALTSHNPKYPLREKSLLKKQLDDKEKKEFEKLHNFFTKELSNDLRGYVKKYDKNSKPFIIPSSFFNEFTYRISKILYVPSLKRNISTLFSENLDKLVNNNANDFSIKYQDIKFKYSENSFKNLKSDIKLYEGIVLEDKDLSIEIKDEKFTIKFEPCILESEQKKAMKLIKAMIEDNKEDGEIISELVDVFKEQPEIPVTLSILDFLFENISRFVAYGLLHNTSYYIPAGKNELLNYLKFFAGQNFAVKNEDFPYVLGYLAKDLINMDYDEESPFYDIIAGLENELFYGETEVDTSQIIPKFTFIRNDGLNLNNEYLSSSISEIRPIMLFLKHKLKKNDTLIIEEPESHLNPKNQRILIKYLIRCINAGLRVLITTHSDYIIDQINNHIMLNNIKNEKSQRELQDKHGYIKEDLLDSELVSVHAFRKNNDLTFNSHEIEITELGIQAEDMDEIAADLYDESYDIKDYLMR